MLRSLFDRIDIDHRLTDSFDQAACYRAWGFRSVLSDFLATGDLSRSTPGAARSCDGRLTPELPLIRQVGQAAVPARSCLTSRSGASVRR
jgi:hypothetical protein